MNDATPKEPPAFIDGARLVRWSPIDRRHRPTGNTRHIVAGVLQGPASSLAICRYDDDDAYYLFGCDAEWRCVTDTWHATLADALDHAEFEYEGVSKTWNVAR